MDPRNTERQQFYELWMQPGQKLLYHVQDFVYECIAGPFRELGESGGQR